MEELNTEVIRRVIKSISLNEEQISFLQNQGVENFSKYVKNIISEKFDTFPNDTKKGRKKVVVEPVNNYITKSPSVANTDEPKKVIRIGCHMSGIGSVDEAIKQMKNSGMFKNIEFKVVYAIEWDIKVREVYMANYDLDPKHFYTDITKVDETELPDVDVIFTSPACQSFSQQSISRKGLEDTRGTLIFESLRIIKYQRPRIVLYENVKGVLNHDKGNTFITIKNAVTDIGYQNEWKVLNSLDFGLPQNRERLFGFFTRNDVKMVEFPVGERTTKSLNDFLEDPSTIDKSYKLNMDFVTNNPKYNPNSRGVLSRTQTHKYMKTTFMSDQRVQCSSGYCGTLTTSSSNCKIFIKDTGVGRSLTPRERIRLQGFSDSFVLPIKKDGSLHKTLNGKISGNTIPVTLVKALLTQVLHSIENKTLSTNNTSYTRDVKKLTS